MQSERKSSYKVPPAAVRDALTSQEHRRIKVSIHIDIPSVDHKAEYRRHWKSKSA